MVGPILSLFARMAVTQGARQRIGAQVASQAARSGTRTTRAAINRRTEQLIAERGAQNIARAGVGVAAYQGASGLLGSGMKAAQIAVGNAIKKTDFQVMLAQTGLSYALDARQRATKVAAAMSVAGSTEGEDLQDWYRIRTGRLGVTVRTYTLSEADRYRLTNIWNRYGYMVQEPMVPPRLDPMTSYSYWQLRDANILGSMPQDASLDISAAFERGTTVWTNVSQIGTLPSNSPREGISY